ncbi:hypothetical protein KDK_11530 [Dictyobacter kobayashii]|uniref:Uncharacterized protein n=1 Tax=Dictyobacter kobayashii TaxID=2014872 RepID=A0A402AE28_9CHLR|nr:hypothetical protein KDK_11530 [Dictyobacter kobayashii]
MTEHINNLFTPLATYSGTGSSRDYPTEHNKLCRRIVLNQFSIAIGKRMDERKDIVGMLCAS